MIEKDHSNGIQGCVYTLKSVKKYFTRGSMEGIQKSFVTKERFPLVVEPKDKTLNGAGFLNLVLENRNEIQKELHKHGGILFRNFPVENEVDFEQFIHTLGFGKFIDYIGGDSPRTKVHGGVYTSTEAPPHFKIPLHNELSFVKNFPRHIYFYCQTPPQEGGQTTVADARKVYEAIDPKIRERFEKKRIKYLSCYYRKSALMDFINRMQKAHKTWLDVFETSDKADVEKKCRENEFDFKWNQNDWIQISQTRPSEYVHPGTQEKVWFNQSHLYDFSPKMLGFWKYLACKILYCRKHMRLHEVFYGDGSKIDRKDLYHILDVLEANTVYFPWQKGDVLVLDNVLAMHGRAAFKGKRRILTAMTG